MPRLPTATPALPVCLQLTRAIGRTDRLDEIHEAGLDALDAGLNVRRASILLVDPDGVMRFKAWRGLSENYRNAVEGHSPWSPQARDIEPIVVPDVTKDHGLAPHLSAIRAENIAAIAFIPLEGAHGLIGQLTLYYEDPHDCSLEELQLACLIGAEVALAVERTRAQLTVKESEARLRFALDAANMGTWDWDLRTQSVRWSDNLERVHGLPPGTFGGTFESYEREIHPEDRARVLASIQRALSEGVPYEVEYRIVAPDGTVRWVEGKGRVERDPDGRPRGMSGVCVNITPRKHAEAARMEALEESSRASLRLAAIVESSGDAVVSKTLDGVITSWNRAAERLFGYSAAEAIGQSIKLIIPQERHAEEDLVLASIRSGQAVEMETVRRHKDGTSVDISLMVSPVRDAHGRVVGASKIARDIGARKRDEAERAELHLRADEANRLKDEFLATLSHELRTPLNAILGYAQMLGMGVLKDQDRSKAITVLTRNAEGLKQIIDDVLDVSRITSGKLRLNVQPVALDEILKNAVATVQPAADAKGVSLEMRFDPQISPVSGDPDRLQQVVWNLLSNALKFTDRGGHVQLRLERVDSSVQIVVSDDGQGIELAFLPHIFERFRQADSRFSREHGGLGLGLAIVRELIELHGGTVSASSAGPGTGATFTVRLPVMKVQAASGTEPDVRSATPGAEAQEIPGRLTGLRLLVVDDEEDALGLLRVILESAGASVTPARSAPRALELLKNDTFDAVITDIGLPRMDGLELIRRVRRTLHPPASRVPAAALSAYARTADRGPPHRPGERVSAAHRQAGESGGACRRRGSAGGTLSRTRLNRSDSSLANS